MRKITTFQFLLFSLLVYWVPYEFDLKSILKGFYIYEIIVYVYFAIIFTHSIIKKDLLLSNALDQFPYKLFGLFVLGALIGHFIGDNNNDYLIRVRKMFVWPGLFILTCILIIKNISQVEKITKTFLLSSTVLGILVLFGESVFKIGSPMSHHQHNERLNYYLSLPGLGELNMHMSQIGVVFGMLLVISVCIFLIHSSAITRTKILLLSLFFGILVIKAQSRGAIVGVVVAIISTTIISKYYNILMQKKIILKGILVIGTLAGAFLYQMYVTKDTTMYTRNLMLLTDPFNSINFLSRIDIWERALDIIFSNIWGFGLFGFPIAPDGNTGIVHNALLYNYFVGGFFTLIALVLIHLLIIKTCFRILKNSDDNISMVISLSCIGVEIVWLVAGLVDPIALYDWGLPVIWLFPALVFTINSNIDNLQHPST